MKAKIEEPVSRVPEQPPKVVSFHPILVPGSIQGAVALMCFGLGEDGLMYQWDGNTRQWLFA